MELGTIKQLRDLPDHDRAHLYLESQGIEAVMHGNGLEDVSNGSVYSGALEIVDESGWDTQEVWATESARPFDLSASYELLKRSTIS